MVIDKKNITQIDTFQNTEVFYENFLAFVLHKTGMLSEKPVLNQVTLWVNDVDNWVGIPLVTCSKNSNLKVLIDSSQTFMSVGPSVEPAAMTLMIFRI